MYGQSVLLLDVDNELYIACIGEHGPASSWAPSSPLTYRRLQLIWRFIPTILSSESNPTYVICGYYLHHSGIKRPYFIWCGADTEWRIAPDLVSLQLIRWDPTDGSRGYIQEGEPRYREVVRLARSHARSLRKNLEPVILSPNLLPWILNYPSFLKLYFSDGDSAFSFVFGGVSLLSAGRLVVSGKIIV